MTVRIEKVLARGHAIETEREGATVFFRQRDWRGWRVDCAMCEYRRQVPETKRHLEARTTLYLVLRKAYQQRLRASVKSFDP